MLKRSIILLATILSLFFVLLSGCKSTAIPSGEIYQVKRGELDIVVTCDGNLTMPDEYDLRFGTMGTVKEILVEEGDKVKQGALLATLDNTTQKNAIRTALFSIQTAANNITVATTTNNPQDTCDHLPLTYPDLSVLRLIGEAQKDLAEAASYFSLGNYKDAGNKLIMTYFDIEVCEDLIKFKPNAAVLAGAKTNSTYYPDTTAGTGGGISPSDAKAVDYLQNYRAKLLNISQQMKAGDYTTIATEFDKAQQEMFTASQLAKSTIYNRGSLIFEYPDTATSSDFLQSSIRALQELEEYMSQSDATAVEAAKKLYIAELNLLVGRDVLENQTSVFVSGKGINWKTLQQYNLALQTAQIGLYAAKQDIMNTAIIAPSDGTVVEVDLKKDYVISPQDYASRIAVKLVDTSSIKFTGLVDEIDITNVEVGQKATITVDAVPDKTFTGTVKFISPYGTTDTTTNVVKFAVTIKLDPTDVELRGGLTATANISSYKAENVLLVPVSMVITTPFGSLVTVIDESTGKPSPRKVTLGKGNSQYFEVLSGLKEGDKVLTPSATPLGTTGGPPPGMRPPGG
jgi:RND family efflux transporter MFP subunit